MGVRRQQMLAHIMDGSCLPPFFSAGNVLCTYICNNGVADSEKGPERRSKVTLSSPLDTPQPPPLTSASEIALASVIKDVLRRVEQTGELKKGSGGKASVTLYRVPSATERRE
jgi:hypothetical protein